jgi:hypothetical protein
MRASGLCCLPPTTGPATLGTARIGDQLKLCRIRPPFAHHLDATPSSDAPSEHRPAGAVPLSSHRKSARAQLAAGCGPLPGCLAGWGVGVAAHRVERVEGLLGLVLEEGPHPADRQGVAGPHGDRVAQALRLRHCHRQPPHRPQLQVRVVPRQYGDHDAARGGHKGERTQRARHKQPQGPTEVWRLESARGPQPRQWQKPQILQRCSRPLKEDAAWKDWVWAGPPCS